VSRIVLGCMGLGGDDQRDYTHAMVMLDRFIEHGGTAIDTAWQYGVVEGDGLNESLIGAWIASREIRHEIVILGKGAHTPFCDPDWIRPQLDQSLERLQTDYIDIYMLHRDNQRYPAGEFLEALNALRTAGLVRAYGVSNWSLERVREAETYARQHGIGMFGAISNQFSLADMIQAPWEGCHAASDVCWREWLTESQTPLMPWSTLAQGFLARSLEESFGDAEMARCWSSRENIRRHTRLRQLAKTRQVPPAAIGVAYVLQQPFPTYALIGPQTLDELRQSLPALEVTLSPQDISFLERGER
jgi:aryl-alcohol dehydrogenase-like predicted oxidoreductase